MSLQKFSLAVEHIQTRLIDWKQLEGLIELKFFSFKVDIWSMGCLLFAMLSGSVPFCDAYGKAFSFNDSTCY